MNLRLTRKFEKSQGWSPRPLRWLKFSATTVDSGTKVALQAKSETSEYLQKTDPTSGTDAGIALGLTTSEVETLRIYKNNIPLSRNGRSAVIESANQTDWSNTIASGETLKLFCRWNCTDHLYFYKLRFLSRRNSFYSSKNKYTSVLG